MNPGILDLVKSTAWPLAIMVVAILLYGLVRRGMVSSVSATKDGIVLGLTPVDQRESYRHAMDKRILAVDNALYLAAKRVTQSLRRTMTGAVATSATCAVSKRAIGADLLEPLFDACDENDFKTHLAAPERRVYLDQKMTAIRDYYEDLSDATSIGCSVDDGENDLPPWEAAEPKIRTVVEAWADRIADAVEQACKAKIDIYTECRPQFFEAKDKYFVTVVDSCIEKNQKYIAALNGAAAA